MVSDMGNVSRRSSVSPKSRRASIMESIEDIRENVQEVQKTHLLPLSNFLENIRTQIVLTVLLMFSLYLADFWQIGNVHQKYDDVMNTILVIIFFIFVMECFLLVISTEKYFLRFFFWMDVLGTLSILLDLTWITGNIVMGSYTGSTNVARAARMAKLAARAGRLVKLLRILRVLMQHNRNQERIFDSFRKQKKGNVQTLSNKIAIKLAKRVAAVVMIQILLLPFLSYNALDHAPEVTLDTLTTLASQNSTCGGACFEDLAQTVTDYYKDFDDDIISINIDGVGFFSWEDEVGYTRSNNILKVKDGDSYIKISKTRQAQLVAAFSVGNVTMAVLLLVGFSVSFTIAMDRLIVRPIDRMMNILRQNMNTVLENMRQLEHVEQNYISTLEEGLETDMLEQILEKMIKIVRMASPDVDEMMFKQVGLGQEDTNTQNYVASQFMRNGMEIAQKRESSRMGPYRQASVINLTPRNLGQIVNFEKAVGSWEFNPLDHKDNELIDFMTQTFQAVEAPTTLDLPLGVFISLIEAISEGYLDQPYHNFRHGVDVCYSTFKLLKMSRINQLISQIDLIAMLIAALAHDIGHRGVNNNFLINTCDELALLHNDQSPLENHHCYLLFTILKKEETNVFKNMDEITYKSTRKLILQVILGTDTQFHSKQMQSLNLLYEKKIHEFNQFFTLGVVDSCLREELDDQRFLLELVLHSADISGPIKPPHISKAWADLVIAEFFSQGEKEKEKGLSVSPMMDKTTTNIPNMQMGFIEYVVAPLYIDLCKLLPHLCPLLDTMLENYKFYHSMKKDELRLAEDEDKSSIEDEKKLLAEATKLDQKLETLRDKFESVKCLSSQLMMRRKSDRASDRTLSDGLPAP